MKNVKKFSKHLFKNKRNLVLMVTQLIVATVAVLGDLGLIGAIILLGIVGCSLCGLIYWSYREFIHKDKS